MAESMPIGQFMCYTPIIKGSELRLWRRILARFWRTLALVLELILRGLDWIVDLVKMPLIRGMLAAERLGCPCLRVSDACLMCGRKP